MINSRILLSAASIAAAAALVIGATFAFFSDTETSTGNTFTAGSLDLKVDNTCYYNKIADGNSNCPTPSPNPQGIVTTWTATDLGATHKFFYFTDVKPGDFGEDTISLSVDNDAWVRLLVKNVVNDDVTCTVPEGVVDTTCGATSDPNGGELRQNLLFTMWLDQGATPGFQGETDSTEGDNIQQGDEPTLISEGTIDATGETWNLADYAGAYLKADETAYFGIAWRLPGTVGNDVQSDSMTADMEIQVEQYRNNPSPFPSPGP